MRDQRHPSTDVLGGGSASMDRPRGRVEYRHASRGTCGGDDVLTFSAATKHFYATLNAYHHGEASQAELNDAIRSVTSSPVQGHDAR